MSRPPDFVVVGAPKCGTTSLYSYLRQSPNAYVPRKELHYFGADLDFSLPTPTREEYERHFAPAGQKTAGDVDVWYLYSRTAATEIREYIPEARIIIMLRNPVDFMYSMHSQAVFSSEEPETDFAKALQLEESRRRGENLPKTPYVRHAIYYRDLARFSEQIERYQAEFPVEQLHFILLDDLAADARREWSRLCRFLDIPEEGISEFSAVNPNKRLRSTMLSRGEAVFRRVIVPRLKLDRFPDGLKDFGKRMLRRMERLNTVYQPRPPLDPALRSALIAECEPEVAALERILGRDLSHWRR